MGEMWWVAEDPEQPGAAYAATHDDPAYKKDTAKFVAKYIKKGVNVFRTDQATAIAMLRKWKRPVKQEDSQ